MDDRALDRGGLSRRALMRVGLGGAAGLGLLGGPLGRAALAAPGEAGKRILVVLEMSGGNDGLNTVVPHGDDAYYRARPSLAIPANEVLRIDEHFGFNPGLIGFERLFKDGDMAIVHGCGYANPSFSHFTSMAYWHTAAPNSGEEYGWVGRLADEMAPGGAPNFLMNIDSRQSLAVRSREHTPVVFNDPNKFAREGFYQEREMFEHVSDGTSDMNPSRRFLLDVARSANEASAPVKQAWANYSSPIDYGLVALDLPKVAALIEAEMPTRLYYTTYRNNAFDTHVFQNQLHQRLLTYTADSLSGFIRDLERIGRADDVVVMVFSEFGRRVPENVSLGTDHGAANLMFVIGNSVKGGHYGEIPSLTELDEGDNLVYTTDFRRVYATVIEGWLGQRNTREILDGDFEPFEMFA